MNEITKFNKTIYQSYIDIFTKYIELDTNSVLPINTDEINIYINNKLDNLYKNNGLIFAPELFDDISRLSSQKYNRLFSNIKIDLEVILDQISNIINLTNMASNIIQKDMDNIISYVNEQSSKIRNLKTLLDTNKEFNNYITDTFNKNDNTYDDIEFNAKHNNGMYRLKPYNSFPVLDDENDASINIHALNSNLTITKDNGDILSKYMLNGHNINIFSKEKTSFYGKINGEDIIYNGLVIAIDIELSDVKHINNLSFNYFSTDNIDIIKILYSQIDIPNYQTDQWHELKEGIDFNRDKEHNGSIDIIFNTILASRIILILGQKFAISKEINADDQFSNKFINNYDINNTLENYNNKLNTIKSIEENTSLNIIKRDKTIYKLPKEINDLESNLLKTFKNFTDSIYGKITRLNDFSGFIYYLIIYNLRLFKNTYKQFSVYESEVIVSDNSLINARISKTDNIIDGTWINYYILYNDKKVRVIEKDDIIKDIYVINNNDTFYKTDFLIDPNKQIKILKNNEEYTNYSLHKINNDTADGINFLDTLQYGDIFIIEYSIPKYNKFNKLYKPWNLNIQEIEGLPNIKHYDLININNPSRILLTTSGDISCYSLSTRVQYDNTSDVNKFYIHKNDIYQINEYDIISLQAPNDEDKDFYLYSLDTGIDPSGIYYKIPEYKELDINGDIKKQQFIINTKKDIYYGIIDEVCNNITNISQDTYEISTEFDYVPGTLVCKVNDDNVFIKEYNDSDKNNNYDKNKATLKYELDTNNDIIKLSYLPINIENNDKAESNIMEFNEKEVFEQTTINNTINLTFSPYIDTSIISQSHGNSTNWIVNNNVYALRDNVSITYRPLLITINGIMAIDKTDYINGKHYDFDEFDINKNNYQYYIENKTIFFNTNIMGNIEINYYKLNDRIKLRAELYRYDMKKYDKTPELYDILILNNSI